MKELYPVSLAVVIVALADKSVTVVASAGCKIEGVIMMNIMSKMTIIAPVLAIQYWPFSHNRNLLINIIVLTPVLVFPTTMDKERSSLLKTPCFLFLRGQEYLKQQLLLLLYAR
jgi:hypothetical protein